MLRVEDLGAECSSLYRQAETVLSGIDKMAKEFGDRGVFIREAEASENIQRLRSDLARLSHRIDEIKAAAVKGAKRHIGDSGDMSVSYLVGGIALGTLLGKLLGSKSQVDLLPLLMGLELASELKRS